jgi:hypothetical protein
MLGKKKKPTEIVENKPLDPPGVSAVIPMSATIRQKLMEYRPRDDYPNYRDFRDYIMGGKWEDEYESRYDHYGHRGIGGIGYRSREDEAEFRIKEQMKSVLDTIRSALGSGSTAHAFVEKVFSQVFEMDRLVRKNASKAEDASYRASRLESELDDFLQIPNLVTLERDADHIKRAKEWCIANGGEHKVISSRKIGSKTHFVFGEKKTAATFKLLWG